MTTLLRMPDVLERTKLTRATLYSLLNANAFPKPIKIGERVNAWPDTEIEEWIQARLTER